MSTSQTYRQITHRLRIPRGPGQPDKVSERPRKGSREHGFGPYLDSEENPTLITIDEGDLVDLAALLQMGAVVPYEPPKASKPVKEVKVNGEGQ